LQFVRSYLTIILLILSYWTLASNEPLVEFGQMYTNSRIDVIAKIKIVETQFISIYSHNT